MTEKKQFILKSKNRRITIQFQKTEGEEPLFFVHTRRLVDFSKREITETSIVYTVETFTVMANIFKYVISDSEVKKLCNPYSKFDKWTCGATEMIKIKD